METKDLERFNSRFGRDGSGCWLWTGSLSTYGYGQLSVQGRTRFAHRLSYEHFVGPITIGLVIDHLCRVPACVNPEHLRLVTRRENTFAMGSLAPAKANAEKTRCPRGHEYKRRRTGPLNRICPTCTSYAQWVRIQKPGQKTTFQAWLERRIGPRKPGKRLTAEEVLAVCGLIEAGQSYYVAGKTYGISGASARYHWLKQRPEGA